MSSVVLATEQGIVSPASEKVDTRPWLAPYRFKKGCEAHPRAGRPKGSRNAETIYLESLPLKARQWVKSTAPAVLIDARKIALPIESDAPSSDPSLLLWFEERLRPPGVVEDTPQNVLPQPVNSLTHDATTS